MFWNALLLQMYHIKAISVVKYIEYALFFK